MFSGAVLGYRGWHVKPGGYLQGPVSQQRWPENGPLHAACKPIALGKRGSNLLRKMTPHKTPDSECGCGIYAFHEFSDSIKSYSNNRVSVIGPGLFWGSIELHTAGFKAEFGRPLAICSDFKDDDDRFGASKVLRLIGEWEEMLEAVTGRYRIPLLPVDLVEEYALTWAKPIGIEYDDPE